MRKCFSVLVFAVLAAKPAMAASGIDRIAWLAGDWVSRQGAETAEVIYTAPEAGTMLGLIRTTAGGQVTFYEFETIAEDQGTLVLSPSPYGKPGVTFTLTRADAADAVFENPTHDFPRRITLAVVDGSLHMKVEGTQNGHDVSQELVMARK